MCGVSLVVVHMLLLAAASLVGEHGLQAPGLSSLGSRALERRSVVTVHRLSCSAAGGIFPDQGSSPCPQQWQADS